MTYGREGIYLDHAATTPTDPSVLSAMLPWFTDNFGNPSSIYRLGQEAHAAVDRARRQVAAILGASHRDILFTSGATESNNLAIRGSVDSFRQRHGHDVRPHIVISETEHHAVLDAARQRSEDGADVSLVPVDSDGRVDPDDVLEEMRENTCLVSVMLANNEIGTLQPVAEIAKIAQERQVPMHTDAVQAAGLLDISVDRLGVDMLSLSAHKFYGPKGVGVLYVRKGTPLQFQQHGGGQESGRRGGTENVPLIVGAGEALQRAEIMRHDYAGHCRVLRDRLWERLEGCIPGVQRNGSASSDTCLPNVLSVMIPNVQGETMLLNLDLLGIAASAGSACTTGNSEPSHVLQAIGLDESQARSTVRFSVGRGNSLDEMDRAAEAVSESVSRIGSLRVEA